MDYIMNTNSRNVEGAKTFYKLIKKLKHKKVEPVIPVTRRHQALQADLYIGIWHVCTLKETLLHTS